VGPVELLTDLAPFTEDGCDFLDDWRLPGCHLLTDGRLFDEGFADLDVASRIDAFECPVPDAVAEEPVLFLTQVVDCVTHFQFEAVGPIMLKIVCHCV